MIDVLLILILAAIIGGALTYIIRSKKKGECIGCPHGKECSSCRRCGENSKK